MAKQLSTKLSKVPAAPPAEPMSADYNSRVIRCVIRFVNDTYGFAEIERLSQIAGIDVGAFEDKTVWLSHDAVEAVLKAARELMPDDATYERACAHRMVESYGALNYVMRALSPTILCRQVLKVAPFMVRGGRFELVSEGTNSFHVRYYSEFEESALLCATRRVQWALGPTIWGLPPADLKEHRSIARGDSFCEYELKWRMPVRVGIPLALGSAAAFAAIATRLLFPTLLSPVTLLTLPALVGCLAAIHEFRRAVASNSQTNEEMAAAILESSQAEAEARAELVAMNTRQRQWVDTLERQLAERAESFEQVFASLRDAQQENKVTIRGFSHDLKNPIFAMRGNVEFLNDFHSNEETSPVLLEIGSSIRQMEDLLQRLNEVVAGQLAAPEQRVSRVMIPALTETLRRRLKALVYGRDIKISVFCTREAPDEILCDNILLDRVLDNLLTNAAKYTHSGSILLELTGRPGVLTLQLSDTGRGIAQNHLNAIFEPRESGTRSFQSQGVGLAGSVELLRQLGGQIEVMSKDQSGSTFWLHLPVKPPAPGTQIISLIAEREEDDEDSKVVFIRRSESA